MAPSRGPAPSPGAQARGPDGRRQGRRAGLHRVPAQHRAKIHSNNLLERLNGEIKRHTDVVGIFPNEVAVVHLIGALLLEPHDEWSIQRRYMSLETLAPLSDTAPVSLPPVAA